MLISPLLLLPLLSLSGTSHCPDVLSWGWLEQAGLWGFFLNPLPAAPQGDHRSFLTSPLPPPSAQLPAGVPWHRHVPLGCWGRQMQWNREDVTAFSVRSGAGRGGALFLLVQPPWDSPGALGPSSQLLLPDPALALLSFGLGGAMLSALSAPGSPPLLRAACLPSGTVVAEEESCTAPQHGQDQPPTSQFPPNSCCRSKPAVAQRA